MHANQPVALIGIISLIVLFGMPKNKNQFLEKNSSTDDCAFVCDSSGVHFELQYNTTGSCPCSYR